MWKKDLENKIRISIRISERRIYDIQTNIIKSIWATEKSIRTKVNRIPIKIKRSE